LFSEERILAAAAMPQEQIVNGYKVKVRRPPEAAINAEAKRQIIAQIMAKGIGK
jgi:hypothetical protein